MKALVVLGPLGSGKTTTLIRLLAQMDKVSDVHLVINEVGRFAVDIDRINNATGSVLDVEGLTAGCLGCANLAEFDDIVARLADKDGVLLVEPTGVADGHEIRAALSRHNVGWRCLTLINPVTFPHDLRAGIVSTQLEVATRIAITRPDGLSEDDRDHMLHQLAPYGVPVIDLHPAHLSGLSINSLLNDEQIDAHSGHHDHNDCDHASHGHGHGHSHNGHGYTTTPVLLRPEITAEQLRSVCAQLDLRRGKGVVAGQWFDRVGTEFTLGEKRDEAPYAILISDVPLDAVLVESLTVPAEVDERSLKQRLSGLSARDAHEEIDRLLAQAGGVYDSNRNLRVADESLDLACEIAKTPAVSPEYRQKSKQARIRHAIGVYDEIDWNVASAAMLVEVGAVMAWQAARRADEVGEQLITDIQSRTPATMWLEGIARTADPRYDLMSDGYGGPLSPSAGVAIIYLKKVEEADLTSRQAGAWIGGVRLGAGRRLRSRR
ncbi:MAG: hypothetical protein EOO17_03295 [Chloroflexi bacterium]|nr:MAG: hypothetical protein EOO17_03295 [Chloroflexota bacterium]